MDHPIASDIYRHTEPGITEESVDKQTRETIKSVANTLASIGDGLNRQRYEELSDSRANLANARSCAPLEGCLDILLLAMKSYN